jgi:hypothetical protein
MNSRIDLLTPTRRERSEGETRDLEVSHCSIGVQTDAILLPTLSETLCSLTTPRVVSVDVSTHTDNRRRSTGTVSTRNNRLLSPTIPVPFTSPLKRASTTPEPETATPQKLQKTNSEVEEIKEEHLDSIITRNRKHHGYRNSAKTRSGHPNEMERVDTPHRVELRRKGVLALRALEALVLGMPWSNELDANGSVIRLGKKDLALYVAVESIAEGCQMETSCNLATRLFDIPADTVKKAWYTFLQNDFNFVASLRGKHPKLQWTLQECGVKVRPCLSNECVYTLLFCSGAGY